MDGYCTPNPISLCNGAEIAPAPALLTELATYDARGGLIEPNTILNANSATLPPGNFPFNAERWTWSMAEGGKRTIQSEIQEACIQVHRGLRRER
jgi:hypothetical protein